MALPVVALGPYRPGGRADKREQWKAREEAVVFKSLSTSLIVRGILAFIIGILALAWPKITILALVILFAIFAFISAGLEFMKGFGSARAGPVIGHILVALLDIGAGVVALVWPGITALVLVVIVGIWAIVGGLAEFFSGFRSGETGGQRALLLIGGLVSVAFGVVLLAHPYIGAFALALLFGMFMLIIGFWLFVAGIDVRRTGKAVQAFPGASTGPQLAGQRGPSAAAGPTGAGTGATSSAPRPREPEAQTAQRTDAGKQ